MEVFILAKKDISVHGASVISKIDKIANIVLTAALGILGALNITGKIPAGFQTANAVLAIVFPAALMVWNIVFPSEKVAESNEKVGEK